MTGQLDAVLSKELVAPRTRVHMMSIRWMAEDGAEVAAGDKVLEFDNSSFASGLEEQRLGVTRANNDLQSQAAANQVAIAEKEYAVARRRIELDKAALRAKVPEDTYTRREYQERQLTHHKAKVEGRKPITVYRLALASGLFRDKAQADSLRVLERV